MKVIRKQLLLTVLAVLVCAAIFTGVSYLFLHTNSQPSDSTESLIPYTENDGTPKGLLFGFDEGGSVFLYFDTEQDNTMAILLPHDCDKEAVADYGYTVFRHIKTDYAMLEGFIDRIGGIEIDNMRYTGVQITEQLGHSVDKQLRRDIIAAIFEEIADDGLKSENLVYIIENSQTDFSFPDGYSLLGNIRSFASNLHFVN